MKIGIAIEVTRDSYNGAPDGWIGLYRDLEEFLKTKGNSQRINILYILPDNAQTEHSIKSNWVEP
jgi:hypothetical protein